jgi:hypothetical protein
MTVKFEEGVSPPVKGQSATFSRAIERLISRWEDPRHLVDSVMLVGVACLFSLSQKAQSERGSLKEEKRKNDGASTKKKKEPR